MYLLVKVLVCNFSLAISLRVKCSRKPNNDRAQSPFAGPDSDFRPKAKSETMDSKSELLKVSEQMKRKPNPNDLQ